MPALLPDIFTAAIKGYEDANNANWQDLKNYEAIEAARTANDTANLGLLGAIEDYGNRIFRNPGFIRSLTEEEKKLRDMPE